MLHPKHSLHIPPTTSVSRISSKPCTCLATISWWSPLPPGANAGLAKVSHGAVLAVCPSDEMVRA